MAEKIGKYRILELVGRGGMGTIYKAHDPILDRPVAIKVISTEVEVTDELRARFFREAQACARLSHANIVTVYDMGEENGRLFIVMEFLEGEELKRLIAQRAALALEDKVSIMAQVCDGLHYAHQKGVVHRDIKPGNVMVLRNGRVKILDFGIAQIANTDAGLTRTGLIMGTLRYIAPEQVQGRADFRSDIFSVGVLFYEFLSLRPAFTGEDPMRLLEQLRTEEPPDLVGLDASIPVELARVIQRAMRKDPEERFADLAVMQAQLEQVQRGLAEEGQRVRGRITRQREQLRELDRVLAERIGAVRAEEAVGSGGEPGRLAALQEVERNLGRQIERAQGQLARAEALGPVYERGRQLLEAGQVADAVVELEGVVAQMPEHARAVEALGRARTQAEGERRRQLAGRLLQEAKQALREGEYRRCLELVKQAAELPPPAEVEEELTALGERAGAALAAQEAAHRMRQQTERAREQMEQARRTALAYTATPYASALWKQAEAKAIDAQTVLARESHGEAQEAFAEAAAAYERFEEAARQAQARERESAEQARAQMTLGRAHAQAAGAPQCAQELWEAAERKAAQAEVAVAAQSLAQALVGFIEAATLYQEAEASAGAARQRQRLRAEEERDRAEQARQAAAAADAAPHGPALGDEAESRLRGVEASAAQEETVYSGPGTDSLEQTDRPQQPTPMLSPGAADTPTGVMAPPVADAPVLAEPTAYAEAPTVVAGVPDMAEAATADGASRTAGRAPHRALGETAARSFPRGTAPKRLWWRSGGGESIRRLLIARRRIIVAVGAVAGVVLAVVYWHLAPPAPLPPPPLEELRKEVVSAREEAIRAGAEPLAEFAQAAEKESAAESAVGPHDAGASQRRYREALAGYRLAKIAGERASAFARGAQSRAAEVRKAAEVAEAPRRAAALWTKAESAQREAEAALAERAFDRAQTVFGDAERIYREAQQTAVADLGKHERGEAERIRTMAAGARKEAERADARRLAPSSFASAQQKQDEAESALNGDPASAKIGFQEALRVYRRAAQEAITQDVALQRAEAAQAQERMTSARRNAEQSAASQRAAPLFAWAEKKQREASAAFGRSEYSLAERLFSGTRVDYETALQEAQRAGDVVATAQSSAEQIRRRAVTYRERAVKAEADRLARDLFSMARAKEVGADELMSQQSFPLAAQAYGEAGDRYLAAARRARERLEADGARSQMENEKKRASQRAPEYRDGLAEEDYGMSVYERLAYKEAAERFRTAETFYARAATKAAAGPSSSAPGRAR